MIELPHGVELPPPLTAERVAELEAKLAERKERLAPEIAAVEARERSAFIAEADDKSAFAGLAAFAQREIEAWAALPCLGELETVGRCTDAFASTCDRTQHLMCPRRQLARLIRKQTAEAALARSQALMRGVPALALAAVVDRVPLETLAMTALAKALAPRPAPTFVVLSGGVGCGKTCAACGWATSVGAHFITAKAFGALSAFGEEIREITNTGKLVLDDLGAEYIDPKGHFLAQLDGLIDHRDAHFLQTVITTNLGVAEFRPRYGVRVADRLRASAVFVNVGGSSLRGKS